MDDFLALIKEETAVLESIAPQIIDPLDPAPVVALFDMYHGQIDEMVIASSNVSVVDEESNRIASEMTLQVKSLVNVLEKERKRIKEPYLNVTSLLDSKVKSLRDRLDKIQAEINKKIRAYLLEEQLKAQAAAQAAEAERKKEQARLDKEAEQTGLPPLQVVIPEPMQNTAVISPAGKVALKTKLEWEVTDFKKLPEELFAVRADDIKKAIAPWINVQIKAGVREISGVRMFETTDIKTSISRGGN